MGRYDMPWKIMGPKLPPSFNKVSRTFPWGFLYMITTNPIHASRTICLHIERISHKIPFSRKGYKVTTPGGIPVGYYLKLPRTGVTVQNL
jgi:hypothetical protein